MIAADVSRAPAASAATATAASPQRVGRYLVFAPFAQGGMASVHMGKLLGSSGFSRLVAVKRLHPMFATSELHYKMLLEEARITSRISHPNVVPIVDVVQEPKELLLVMEYVAGVSLADLILASHEYGEPPPPAVTAAIVVDVLRGLHAAHEARSEDGALLGVVHRDVSPHNVLVGIDGTARVLDFGIAKALRKDQLTASGDLKGKASYLAPEQLRGLPATRQTDIFAAGIVLWEALAGRRLYDGEPAIAMLRILEDTPVAPSEHVPSLPRALDALALRALSREPRDRFATAEEMALELIDAITPATREEVARYVSTVASDELDRRQHLAREAERASTPAIAPEPSTFPEATSGVVSKPTLEEAPSTRKRGLVMGAAAAAALAAAVAIGVGVTLAGRGTADGGRSTSRVAEPSSAATVTTAPTATLSPAPPTSAPPVLAATATTPNITQGDNGPTESASASSASVAKPTRTRPPPARKPSATSRELAPEDSTAAADRR